MLQLGNWMELALFSCVFDEVGLVVLEYKYTGAQLVLPLQGALRNLSSGSKVIIYDLLLGFEIEL